MKNGRQKSEGRERNNRETQTRSAAVIDLDKESLSNGSFVNQTSKQIDEEIIVNDARKRMAIGKALNEKRHLKRQRHDCHELSSI